MDLILLEERICDFIDNALNYWYLWIIPVFLFSVSVLEAFTQGEKQ